MSKAKLSDGKSETDKARFNLKHNNIKANFDDSGNLTFIIPKSIEEKIKKEYNFSVDKLNVGGDIPLADLAIHCDEQASSEFHIGTLAEFTRFQHKQKQDEYDAWFQSKFYETKQYLLSSGEKSVTDKSVEGRLRSKQKKKIKKFTTDINTLEMQYRLLNNVIKASIITKGMLLGTIRNIIQGKDGIGIGEIKLKKAKKIRKKLKIIKS